MAKELVLRRIVERDGNHYPHEINLHSDDILVLQRFTRPGHVGGTIELQLAQNEVKGHGTWGKIKVSLLGVQGDKVYMTARERELNISINGKLYLGPDGVYQLQYKYSK